MSKRIIAITAGNMFTFLFGDMDRKEKDEDLQDYAKRLEEFGDLIDVALAGVSLPEGGPATQFRKVARRMQCLRLADQFAVLEALRTRITNALGLPVAA